MTVLERLSAEGSLLFRDLVLKKECARWAEELTSTLNGWRSLLPVHIFGPNPLYKNVEITDARIVRILTGLELSPIKTAYATRYKPGDKLARHSDAVHGHPRFVLLLRKPICGGVLKIEDVNFDVDVGDAILHDGKGFHEVSVIDDGERMSLLCEVIQSDAGLPKDLARDR